MPAYCSIAKDRLRNMAAAAKNTEAGAGDTPPSTAANAKTAEVAAAVAYLGPSGTFTEQALLTQSDLASAEHRKMPSITDALMCAERGEVPMAFAAIENSIEGSVNATLDVLAFEADLLIQREVVMPIELHLLGLAGAETDGVKEVLSYPHAFGQCREFLHEHLPMVKQTTANSTAEAAELVVASDDPTRAAIGTRLAAEIHGLSVLWERVEDHRGNQTRFVAVAKDSVPAPSGKDKTSLVVFQRENKPGSLLGILQEFADQSIDLTKLQSRPTKKALGEYCFIVDFLGHAEEPHVAHCLEAIRSQHADIKFLGSYSVAEPV